MKLIPKILLRIMKNKDSDITINEMREIHKDLLEFESKGLFDQIAESIIYNFAEEEKKSDDEILFEGLIDGSMDYFGTKRETNDHIQYFNTIGFIFNDDTYPSAFGKSHYIYRSKGSRILWFEDGNIVFSSLYTYFDSSIFQFLYEEIERLNIFNSHFDDDALLSDYWSDMYSADLGKVAYSIIKNLMNINMNFNRDYPLEHLFISEDVRKLSEYSKKIRNDIMEHVIELCKMAIIGNDSAFDELKFFADFLNLVEIDVPSYELIELIKFISDQSNIINPDNLNLVISMLNQNSKNNSSYYLHDIDSLIEKINNLETGKSAAYDYQHVIQHAFEIVFDDQLFRKQSEVKINAGRKRIDIMFSNEAESGFFYRLKNDYRIFCPNIIVECKNYSYDPTNEEVDQLLGRLNKRIGNFGILAVRSISNIDLLNNRFRDAFKDDKHIIYLTDKDIITILEFRKNNMGREINDFMNKKYEEIML